MYKDLREFIEQVDKLGALRRIDGADPRFRDRRHHRGRGRARRNARRCCSTASRASPRGFRIFTNATTTPQRAALALGIDPALRPLDALKAWMAEAPDAAAAQAGRR